MKYIDAEKLIAKIKELNLVTKTYEEQVTFNNTLAMVVEIIDSLQQEQPKSSNDKFVFPNFLYVRTVDNKTIDVSYAPQSMDAVEYIKNNPTEQQEVDFEKEFAHEYAIYHLPAFILASLADGTELIDFIYKTARHFYKLGKNSK